MREQAVLEERSLLWDELIGEGLSEGDVKVAMCLFNEYLQKGDTSSAADARLRTLAEVYEIRREIAVDALPKILAAEYAIEDLKAVRREVADCLEILRKDPSVDLGFVKRARGDTLARLAREAWKRRRAARSVLARELIRAEVIR